MLGSCIRNSMTSRRFPSDNEIRPRAAGQYRQRRGSAVCTNHSTDTDRPSSSSRATLPDTLIETRAGAWPLFYIWEKRPDAVAESNSREILSLRHPFIVDFAMPGKVCKLHFNARLFKRDLAFSCENLLHRSAVRSELKNP